ncbi:MAG: anion permease [Candidatus Tectomicrobia bacterium]|nr:anion permease [Candidatus Tectomicrobia bacterium]
MKRAGTLAGILLPLLLLVAPLPESLSAYRLPGALVIFTILFWMTEVLPAELTSLIFLLLLAILKVAPNSVIFSGFTAGAWWLVFAGLTLGAAVQKSGLGRRVALLLLRVAGTSYAQALFGLMLAAFLLAFLIPSSSARAALMVPLAIGVAEAFQVAPLSAAGAGLVLGVTAACHFPAFGILTATVPNLVLLGTAESLYNTTFLYGTWAYLLMPTVGIAKFFLTYLVVLLLFGRGAPRRGSSPHLQRSGAWEAPGPLSAEEKRLIIILGLALAGWSTDSLHQIKASWIGLGAAALALLPRLGTLTPLDFRTRINYSALFFLAGILGLGSTLHATGAGKVLGTYLFTYVPLASMSESARVAVVALFSALLGLFTTVPALPAVLTPILGSLAQQQQLDLSRLLVMQVLGFSVGFFVYQMPPFVLAQGFGYFSARQGTRFLLLLTALSFLIIVPLSIAYWRLIGYLS